jgi:hypothetical protein
LNKSDFKLMEEEVKEGKENFLPPSEPTAATEAPPVSKLLLLRQKMEAKRLQALQLHTSEPPKPAQP